MLLAVAALILHVHAIPQNVTQVATNSAESSEIMAPTEAAKPARAAETTSYVANSAQPLNLDPYSWREEPRPRPVSTIAYTPGRLVPEPVAPPSHLIEEPAEAPAVIPATPAATPVQSVADQAAQQARADHRRRQVWLVLSAVQFDTAEFDAAMTRRVISSGVGQELNPLLRPFAGNASLYFVAQVMPTLLDYAGHRLMTNQRGWARRTWWIPQTVGAIATFAGGVHNIGVHQ